MQMVSRTMIKDDSRSLARPITPSEIADYQRDGVVCLRGVFSTDWIEMLRDAFEEAKINHGPHAQSYREEGEEGEFFFDVDVWTRLPRFKDFVFNSPAGEIAATLMQSPSVRLFYDQLFIKEPGEVAPTPWHQDQPYWQVDGEQICTIWLPLDPVPKSIGVEYVRGSQRIKTLYSPTTFSADHALYDGGLPPVPDIEAHRDDYDIVS